MIIVDYCSENIYTHNNINIIHLPSQYIVLMRNGNWLCVYVFNCDGVREDNREYLQLKEHDIAIQACYVKYGGTYEENHLQLKVIFFGNSGRIEDSSLF